jgi:hypothetical protein
MNLISELQKQYFEIENQYYSKEFDAHVKGFIHVEEEWRRKRELNTHAYFLFLFTRLEEHINVQTKKLILHKRANIRNWKTRAIWDNTDFKKLYFKKKVGLLSEIGKTDYNRIVNYYELRNKIAHGGTIPSITVNISMINVFSDMERYFRILKK